VQLLHYTAVVPTLVRLSKSKICMYPADHHPPHFHILANDGKQCLVQISPMIVLQGRVGAAALVEALGWAGQNAATLIARWTVLNP